MPVYPKAGQRAPLDYRRVGRYHAELHGPLGAMPCGAGLLYAIPFHVPGIFTADRISINVTVAGAGLARLGIYVDDGDSYPGPLVLDAGTVDVSAIGIKEIVINQPLYENLYWLSVLAQVDFNITSNILSRYQPSGQGAATVDTQGYACYRVNVVWGALPDPYPGGAAEREDTHDTPMVRLRKA